MRPGDKLRFRGPADAPFLVTVGVGFDERTINARVASGEWTPIEDETPVEEPKGPAKRRAPRKAAAKKPPASE